MCKRDDDALGFLSLPEERKWKVAGNRNSEVGGKVNNAFWLGNGYGNGTQARYVTWSVSPPLESQLFRQ